jgi:endonuclease/exonuclease/phosphatase family metal-dependent hydrolase
MRLVTFNILHGRSVEDGRVDIDRFREAIRELNADILALQEVDRDQPRSFGSDLTAVAAEAMGAKSHRYEASLVGTPGEQWVAATGHEQPGPPTYGIALLSRFPAHDWHATRMPAIPFGSRYAFRCRAGPSWFAKNPGCCCEHALTRRRAP